MNKKNNKEVTNTIGEVKFLKVKDLMFDTVENGKAKKITFNELIEKQVEKVNKK